MFWLLLTAHLIADFPLQSDWMVRNKLRPRILLLHVLIHFIVMLVVTLPASAQVWPALLALAAVHFGIDTVKNWFTVHRPAWVFWPYLVDQGFHLLSLAGLTAWLSTNQPGAAPALAPSAAVVLTGFLLVTFVWRITERILMIHRRTGPGRPSNHPWIRLGYRAALLAVLLLAWEMLSGGGISLAAAPVAILSAYPNNRSGRLALVADLALTSLIALLVIWIKEGVP